MKKFNFTFLLITAIFILVLSHVYINKSYAYSEGSVLGSSVLACSEQLYIDSIKVNNPYEVIAAKSNKPSIFGYTQSNVTVHLSISDNPGKRVTTTDSNGYWIYNPEKPLSNGTHKLSLSISDNTGASTSAQVAATFNVPAVLGASAGTDVPQLFQNLNYMTISLLVFGTVLVLALLYVLARKYREPEWNVL